MDTPVGSFDEFARFVQAAPLGVVASVDPTGHPEAALVSLAVTPAGDLLFNSATATRKITNLAAEPRIAVVVGCTGDVSWQVEGRAVIESGAARLAAARVYDARFPGSRASDGGFSVVRVRPEWIRRYDAGCRPAQVAEGRPAWVR